MTTPWKTPFESAVALPSATKPDVPLITVSESTLTRIPS